MKHKVIYFALGGLLAVALLLTDFLTPDNKSESVVVEPVLSSTQATTIEVTHSCDSDVCAHKAAPSNQIPAAIDTAIEDGAFSFLASHLPGKKQILSPDLNNLLRAHLSVGDKLSLNLPNFQLIGRTQSVHVEGGVTNVGIDLENGLGRVVFTIHKEGRIRGNILLNGRAEAYLITGQYGEPLEIMDTTVSSLLCAPAGATYPLTNNAGFLAVNSNPRQSIAPAQASFTQIALSSLPSSDYVIYLDFDGDTITSPSWNGGNTIDAVPHPQAANDSWVTVVWQRVAEDFAPFNINVTTDRIVYNSTEVSKRVICVVTPTTTAQPGSGGVAYLNSFGNNVPCWTFNLSEYACADTISHEVGHTLGLVHDGASGDNDQYYDGHGTGETAWGPIMGAPFSGANENVTQWSQGEYSNAVNYFGGNAEENTQDDLQLIAANGFGYRADDHINSATPLASGLNSLGAVINDGGVIETTGDIDFFRFSSLDGVFNISANALDVNSQEGENGSNTLGANLALELALYDSTGILIEAVNPTSTLGASITRILTEGEYYLSIQGASRGDPASTGFSDYASLGQYTLTGTLSTGPLSVSGGANQNVLVVDGDSTPQVSDGTAFGLTAITNTTSLESAFKFENTSPDVLTISSIDFAEGNFSINAIAPLDIPIASSLDRTVVFVPAAIGIVKDTLLIEYFVASDPSRTYTYSFTLQAVVTKTSDDDNYEENDNLFTATSLPENVSLINVLGDGRQTDNDWYRINVLPGFNEISIDCTFIHADGDINIALYDGRGYLKATSATATDNESIATVVDSEGGNYHIRVYGDNSSNTYNLLWEGLSPSIFIPGVEDKYESNNNFPSARDKAAFLPIGAMLSSVDGEGTQYDSDWYKLIVDPNESEITVTLSNTSFTGAISLGLYNSRGSLVATSAGDGINEQIVYNSPVASGTYYARVYGDNSGVQYDLLYDDAGDTTITIGDDNYEQNDTFFSAYSLVSEEGMDLSNILGDGIQLDNDWYKIAAGLGENVIEVSIRNVFSLVGNPDETDVTMTLYDSRGYPIYTLSNIATDDTALIRVKTGEVHYLHFGGANAGHAYDFAWESRFVSESDDIFEDNDTRLTSFDLTGNENQALSRVSDLAIQGDDDWFEIQASTGDKAIRARINFKHLDGDLSLGLYDSDGDLVSESTSTNDNEFIAVTIPEVLGAPETYYLYVSGPNLGTEYDLSWSALTNLDDDAYEPNNDFDSAHQLPAERSGSLAGLSGLGIQADDDYYILDVPTEVDFVQIFVGFDHALGDIDLNVFNASQVRVGTRISVTDNEFIRLPTPVLGGFMYILINFGNAGNEYDLEWAFITEDDDEGFLADADLDQFGDAWEYKYFGRLTAVNSLLAESNIDNDLFPVWAEYALDTDPNEADSSILQSYLEEGHIRVKYTRSKDAVDAGYRYTVLESDSLDFSNPVQSPLIDTIDHGNYEEVIYRSTHSADEMSQCFFRLKVEQPE
jgi:hypothetical protein